MKKYLCLLLSFLILTSSVPFVLASDSEMEEVVGKYEYRNDTYQFSIMDKDPMFITDEEFFGKYDKYGNVIIDSYFNYEKFPELAEVEMAAKDGDYETAKVALYEYYMPQKYDKIREKTSIDATNLLHSEMQARNFYATTSTGTPIHITDFVGMDWETVSVETNLVLDYVKRTVSSDVGALTFVVASVDKSNTAAEIKSKDTDAPPTLSLVVNNVQKTYTAVEDSYISPGDNAGSNYGQEPILYAQEYGYHGHWSDSNNLWGRESSPTKRTYIKFDLSDLKSTDTISSAVFSFDARTAADGDLTEKELFIYGWENSSWIENSICWNSFSDWLFFSCNEQEAWDFVTASSSTLKGKLCFYHRGSLLSYVAGCYNYTKEQKYAYTFMRQLMSHVNNVGANTDVMNQLDLTNHIKIVGDSFIACWGSDVMTPTMFTACMKHFYLTMEETLKILDKETMVNNTATNMTASTFYMCQKYPEFKRADHWYERTLYHNSRLYKAAVFEDGVSIEQALIYVNVFINTLDEAILILDNVKNLNYGNFFDEDGINMLHGIVKNWYYSMAPGYTGLTFGDSADYGKSYQGEITKWYGKLLKMGIDDPELEYVATNGKSGVLPGFNSISFPDAKRTYMRSSWSDDAVFLGFTAKGDGASHAHLDVLHISLMAYGQHLLIDPGYGSVLTGETFDYMIHASQHNLVTVNGGNLLNSVGMDSVEKEMELNNLYDMATYSFGYLQNANNSERTVLFLKKANIFVVTDYVQPSDNSRVNTYTQFWHMQPSANISLSEDGKNEFRSNFERGANVIVSPVDSENMSDIRFEDTKYAPAAGKFADNLKGVYERKSKGNVKYGTVIYPYMPGDERVITTQTADVGISDEGASAFSFTVTNPTDDSSNTYYYYHLNDISQKREITLGKYKTDATALLVQEDQSGKALSFFIYDGSYIEQSNLADKYLFKSVGGNVTLGVDVSMGNTATFSSDSIDRTMLDKVTVYGGFNTSTASFNGERVFETKKDGAYIYFGEEPIVKCTESAPNDSNEEEDLDDFVGGGSGSGGGGSSGGSSGGGGNSLLPNPDDDEEQDEQSSQTVNNNDDDVKITFNDVKETDWYYEYVTELTEKGIVSGDGTGSFEPTGKVTREQFLKMLIIAANVDIDEEKNTFSDVLEHAWYKPYVLKAKNLGIVNGVSDTKFGIGSNITRQDMAVMITRTIEKLGIEIEAEKVNDFADNNDISDYAKDSVTFMKSIGLIEGYNNEFRPLDNLTRAEASKIIFELMILTNIK